jgi:hypothetical protein
MSAYNSAFGPGGQDDFNESPYPSNEQRGYKYTPLIDSFDTPRSHTAMPFSPMPMPNVPSFHGDFSNEWGYGQDPVNMRSMSAPHMMHQPSFETLLRPDWRCETLVEDDVEDSGKKGKRSWPCIFKDCRKVYTTGAGLRYHLHNFHNSPSPRFINRPSVLFPCLKCKKSYVTKAGLRYHKSKSGHGKSSMGMEMVMGC